MGGTTALLAAEYLDRYQGPFGYVVTADVVEPIEAFSHRKIAKAQVWPHSWEGLLQYPWCKAEKLRAGWQEHLATSAADNAALLLEALRPPADALFDLAYVDGDHSEVGLARDLEIVEAVTRPPHFALLDDVHVPGVPAGELYRREIVNEWRHYDFEGDGWENFREARRNVRGMPRMALVWKGKLYD